MFLTAHVAVGALIGQQVNSPILAFILGFFSHWLLDAIPHGDEVLLSDKHSESTRKKILFIIVLVDSIGILFVYFFLKDLTVLTTSMVLAGLGAVLPDLLWGLSSLLPFKTYWESLNAYHNRFHTYFRQKVGLKTGLTIQVLTLILTVLAIVR